MDNADLRQCTFLRANLQGASLCGADLQFALFAECHIEGADFRNAICGGTCFSLTDLSKVRYLARVQHSRASELGVDTLTASARYLPREFTRGCGIDDDVLSMFMARSTEGQGRFYSAFISYSHKDIDFVRRLHDKLQNSGVRCWLDRKDFKPGDDIHDAVDRGIEQQERVLLCASRHSLTSWWVDAELEVVFNKERAIMHETKCHPVLLIPLNLDDYMFSAEWQSGKRQVVRSRVAADFRDPAKFEREFTRLLESLKRDSPA
jgi:hypothetical protein